MNKKGFFFTIGILLLLIPLIFLISYYISKSSVAIDDVTGKLRCDELHYFVEDVARDMSRATAVFGRRGAVYAVDYVVSSGDDLEDYVFNCTSECGVDCSEFTVSVNGSEAALTELVLCGTLFGGNVTYMMNHTLSEWVDKMRESGADMSFNVSIMVDEVNVIPYDAFSFALMLNLSFMFSDANSLCFYEKSNIVTESVSSIEGLEDPLYALRTDGDIIKYLNNCTLELDVDNLAGSSGKGWGNGSGGGIAFFGVNISHPDRSDYCTTHNVSGLVLIITTGFGSCNQLEQSCFNISTPEGDHFEAVINYGPDNPSSFSDKCVITIPWISDTGAVNISEGECTYIKNIDSCDMHNVYNSVDSSQVNTSCYQVSDVSMFLDGCDEPVANGPSFFDRLDGSLNLSTKYANQSLTYFGTDLIGLETFISPYELNLNGKTVQETASWIDYLYWQNVTGCSVPAVCQSGSFDFVIDCPHARYFHLDSSCYNASGVEPSSQITSPVDGANLDCSLAPFMVLGNASDCDDGVSFVSVFVGGFEANSSLTGANWSVTWTPTSNGSHYIVSQATDESFLTETVGDNISVIVYDCDITSTSTSTTTTQPIQTCSQYCVSLGGYISGTCRQNTAQCTGNGEIYESGGDMFCTGGPSADTCCCQPLGLPLP